MLDKVTCGTSKLMVSGIGGIKNTQGVVDLCAKHNIVPAIKIFPAEELNNVFTLLDGANKHVCVRC